MALELVLTYKQSVIVNLFEKKKNEWFYGFWMNKQEWQELISAGCCWLDNSGYTPVYRAHETYTTPDFEMCEPDAKGISTEAGDSVFEDSAASQRLIESGWMQR